VTMGPVGTSICVNKYQELKYYFASNIFTICCYVGRTVVQVLQNLYVTRENIVTISFDFSKIIIFILVVDYQYIILILKVKL